MIVPTSKYLQGNYRREFRAGDAPNIIDTEQPIQAVLQVNNGLPRPSLAQNTQQVYYAKSASSNSLQVATVTANQRVFILGYWYSFQDATAYMVIEDGDSGDPGAADGETNILAYPDQPTKAVDTQWFPFPLEMKRGIRLRLIAGAGSTSKCIIFYYTEATD